MSFEVIGDSLKSLLGARTEEYHKFVYASGLIWAFSQKFHQQPSFNWGQRVAHKGGYAISFDTSSHKWGEVIEFAPLTTEENVEELIFTINDQIFCLLLTAFGQIAPLKLFEWNGDRWTERTLQVPAVLPALGKDSRVTAHIVDDDSSSERYILGNADSTIQLFKLSFSGQNASIEFVKEVPSEVNIMRGQAVSGVRSNGRVIISFMVLGCGYMWQKNRFIVFEESSGEFKEILVPDDASMPPFGHSGSAGHGLTFNGDWLHAGGLKQVGMTGSQFEGSIWALKDLSTNPIWEKLEITIPSEIRGDVLIDSLSSNIYLIGDSVARISFN